MKHLVSVMLIALTLAACGDGETTDPVQTPPAVASVAVTPSTATLVSVGETVQLTASALDANGNAISGKTFTWSSSDESLAIVSSSGLVTAVANGSVTITATTDGVNGTATVLVDQTVASAVVTPASATLGFLGETVQLTAEAREANGTPIPGTTFTWSSSDAGVVAVTSSGLVTALANGSVTITATADGVEGTAAVDVDQPGVKLAFVMAPSDGQAGTVITPPVQVSIQDALDNVVTSAVPPITVELGTNTTGAALAGATVNAVAGVASFDDLVIDNAGPGYTLIATSGALVSATSAPFSACLAPPSGMVNWWPGEPQPFQQQLLFEDPFDVLDRSKWFVFGPGIVESQGGKLFVQSGTSGSSQSTGLAGQVFADDFDIVVDFSDFEIFAPGSPTDLGALTLQLGEAFPPGAFGNHIHFERRFENGSHVIHAEVVSVLGTQVSNAPYTDTFGQLRIVRTGSIITLQFRTSPAVPFTTLTTQTWVTETVGTHIFARNDNFGTGVRGKFDNFRVVSTAADVIDVIGGNTGKFRGGSFAPGKVKQAFSFSNGVVTLQSQPPVSQGFTIDAWVKFDGANFDGYQNIFNNNQVFLRKNGFSEGNKFAVFVKLADGRVDRAQSPTPAVPGVFYHVAATWDGTTLKLYLDGQLEGTNRVFPGPLTSTTVLAQIGRGEQTQLFALPFSGLIDEFTIFDRALSAENVLAIFNAGSAGKCGS